MSAVFADTAFFVAAVSPRDAFFQQAASFLSSYSGQIVTTEFVLLEVANFFNHVGRRQAFVDLVGDIRNSSIHLILPSTSELFEKGLALFASRVDKNWSLVDCTSFASMQDLALTDALTSDRHFEQAGFRILLNAPA